MVHLKVSVKHCVSPQKLHFRPPETNGPLIKSRTFRDYLLSKSKPIVIHTFQYYVSLSPKDTIVTKYVLQSLLVCWTTIVN